MDLPHLSQGANYQKGFLVPGGPVFRIFRLGASRVEVRGDVMFYRAGDTTVTVGLTSLSRPPIMANKMVIARGKKKSRPAYARLKPVMVWECSECGTLMPNNDPKTPPVRCSNRASCGKMFANGKEH